MDSAAVSFPWTNSIYQLIKTDTLRLLNEGDDAFILNTMDLMEKHNILLSALAGLETGHLFFCCWLGFDLCLLFTEKA